MDLSDFKEQKQRQILKSIGQSLIEMSTYRDAEDVELMLVYLQKGFLDELSTEYGDFFGSEGWEHMLGLDE